MKYHMGWGIGVLSLVMLAGCSGQGSATKSLSANINAQVGVNIAQERSDVGSYEDFSPEKLAAAKGKKIVLFFHAAWCPSCRFTNGDLDARRWDIPGDLLVFKIDYDTAMDLRRKYGVTMQHTFILVNEKGEMIKKGSALPTLDAILGFVRE